MRLEDLIGQRIAACRGSKMTQTELGERIGAYLGKPWSRQTVSAAEKGGRAFTAMELLVLALVLDVPLAYLFADAEAAEDEARDVETPGGQSVPIDQVFRHLAPEHGEVDSLRARVAELAKLLDRHMQTKATGTPYPEFMADYLNSSMPTERKLEMAKLGSTTVGQRVAREEIERMNAPAEAFRDGREGEEQ